MRVSNLLETVLRQFLSEVFPSGAAARDADLAGGSAGSREVLDSEAAEGHLGELRAEKFVYGEPRQLAATAACGVFERDLAFFEAPESSALGLFLGLLGSCARPEERLRSEVGFAEAKRRSARRHRKRRAESTPRFRRQDPPAPLGLFACCPWPSGSEVQAKTAIAVTLRMYGGRNCAMFGDSDRGSCHLQSSSTRPTALSQHDAGSKPLFFPNARLHRLARLL